MTAIGIQGESDLIAHYLHFVVFHHHVCHGACQGVQLHLRVHIPELKDPDPFIPKGRNLIRYKNSDVRILLRI